MVARGQLVQLALLSGALAGSPQSCPADSPLSCSSSSNANTCCFNSPGGLLLQTQFWDYSPATGPDDSWTIHGLWPDNCDGTYQSNCDSNRAYTNISDILQQAGADDTLSYMNTYWKDYQGNDETFWEHEWGKHGTCISTLDPDCYTSYQPTQEVPDFFGKTVELFKGLNSYQLLASAGITPDSSKSYALSDVQKALAAGHSGHTPYVGCSSGAINEIWYFFNTKGNVQSGQFIPTDIVGKSTSCPSSVTYPPKNGGGSSSPSSTKSSTAPSSTPTGGSDSGSFSGSGYLNVISGGKQTGCIISGGTWYTSGTCATFTVAAASGGFTLKGSKGFCAVSNGQLGCSASTGTVFSSSGKSLQYQGSSNFYAKAAASGSTQQTVYTSQQAQTIQIQWGSK